MKVMERHVSSINKMCFRRDLKFYLVDWSWDLGTALGHNNISNHFKHREDIMSMMNTSADGFTSKRKIPVGQKTLTSFSIQI